MLPLEFLAVRRLRRPAAWCVRGAIKLWNAGQSVRADSDAAALATTTRRIPPRRSTRWRWGKASRWRWSHGSEALAGPIL